MLSRHLTWLILLLAATGLFAGSAFALSTGYEGAMIRDDTAGFNKETQVISVTSTLTCQEVCLRDEETGLVHCEWVPSDDEVCWRKAEKVVPIDFNPACYAYKWERIGVEGLEAGERFEKGYCDIYKRGSYIGEPRQIEIECTKVMACCGNPGGAYKTNWEITIDEFTCPFKCLTKAKIAENEAEGNLKYKEYSFSGSPMGKCTGCPGEAICVKEIVKDEARVIAILTIIGSGKMEVKRAATGEWETVYDKTDLWYDDEIRTLDSWGQIIYPDHAHIRLKPESRLIMRENELMVRAGGTWIRVVKRGMRFKIKTPTLIIGIRGTSLEVFVDEEENTEAKVTEGTVDVSDLEGILLATLVAGEAYDSETGATSDFDASEVLTEWGEEPVTGGDGSNGDGDGDGQNGDGDGDGQNGDGDGLGGVFTGLLNTLMWIGGGLIALVIAVIAFFALKGKKLPTAVPAKPAAAKPVAKKQAKTAEMKKEVASKPRTKKEYTEAMKLLRKRYAEGKLSESQFNKMKKNLEG